MSTNGGGRPLSGLRVWMSSPARSRGPAPAYSRERIADTAVRIADEHGLDAVTMRRVAAELGTGAMSLYRYVESKDDLFELMGDRMIGRQGWPELTGDWREDLRGMARAQRTVLLEHPWLLTVWRGRPSMGPNMLRAFERAMSIVDGLGLDIDEMAETISMVNTWIWGYVRTELDTAAYFGGATEEEIQRVLEPYLERLVRSGDYPYFARLVEESKIPRIDAGRRFERALDRVVAGIGATLPPPGRA